MAINKLRKIDGDSVGVTLPKDDARLDGLIDEDGELTGEHHLHVDREEKGKWSVKLADGL